MTHNKKRVLFSSVVALVLCCAMLIGTTLAWFTDSVSSVNNVINAGNLDIELYHKDPIKGGDYVAVGEENLFDDVLWEPGHVEVESLKIQNLGTLHLKYQFQVNVISEIDSINEAGQAFKLSDYIQFAVIDNAFSGTREDAVTAAEAADAVSVSSLNWTIPGTMAPNESKEVTLVVWMPESVGNEANYMTGKAVPEITLGVNLLATQVANESDSFGTNYDENAWGAVAEIPTPDKNGVVEVYTAEQLAGVMANTTGIKTINIKEDINLAGRTWTPAFVSAPDLVINGNGHSISNMSTSGYNNVGFIGAAYQDITIKDLTFKNAKVNATGSFVGGVIGNAWGGNKITLENVDLVDSEITTSIPTKAIRVGGLIGYSPYTRGDLTLKDCDVTDSTIAGYHNVGAMVGTMMFSGPEQGKITVENCTAKNNTLKYGSPKVGAFAFGASVDGYTAYEPAAGFTAENNKAVAVISNAEGLDAAIQAGNKTIELGAGTYTFPASKLQDGQTLICEEGTVFEGKTDLNINGATIVGATFTNNNDYLVNSTTINGTFKDCVFTNCDGLRYCYAGETVVFENCVFDTDFYGVHFDGGENEVVFRNCTFSGFNTFGGALKKLTMENCTFKYNGKGGYNGINMWGNTDMIGCTFVFDDSASYEWVDLASSNQTVSFTNCVVTDGTTETPIKDVVGNYGDNNTIIIDGVTVNIPKMN